MIFAGKEISLKPITGQTLLSIYRQTKKGFDEAVSEGLGLKDTTATMVIFSELTEPRITKEDFEKATLEEILSLAKAISDEIARAIGFLGIQAPGSS